MRRATSSLLALIVLWGILALAGAVTTSSHSNRAFGEESGPVTLDVLVLPTSNGADGTSGLYAERYPKSIEVNDAVALADRIAAYGAGYRVWIAPKGWIGSAAVAFDGRTTVNLHPLNGSPKSESRFSYADSGGCAGCALTLAAPYFPNAMQELKKSFGEATPEALPRDIKLTRVSPTLVMYALPDGERLLCRGAAYFIPPNEDFSAKAEFYLPHTDARLLKFLVDTAVSQQKWK